VDSSELENMHTTAMTKSCVEVSSYDRGFVVKTITLIAKQGEDSANTQDDLSQCNMKCDIGYYNKGNLSLEKQKEDPLLKCSADDNKTAEFGKSNYKDLKCEPKFCIVRQKDYSTKFKYVNFTRCYKDDRFAAIRNKYDTISLDKKDIILQAVGNLTSCNLDCNPSKQKGVNMTKNQSADTTLRFSPWSNSHDRGSTNEDGIRVLCVDNKSLEHDIFNRTTEVLGNNFLGVNWSIMMIVILIVVTFLVLVIVILVAFSMDRISYRRVKKHVKTH